MIRKLIRFMFAVVGAVVGYGAFLLSRYLLGFADIPEEMRFTEGQQIGAAVVFAIIFSIFFFRLTPTIRKQSKKVATNIERDLQGVAPNEILVGTFGLITGLVVAFLISDIFKDIQVFYLGTILTIFTYLVMAFIGVVVATRLGPDLPTLMSSGGSKREGVKGKGKSSDQVPKILDTSVIIDGRIADIMRTGFLEGPIVIPEFVIGELQHIADSSDGLKRNRGRRGLDVLNRIQSEHGIEIYNTGSEKALEEIPEVDIKLLKLAQMMNGKVVTNDFNLNKVAGIKGVGVLNINELANTLKPVVLPGEGMTVFLVKEGKEQGQAVAYLDDGTMIVVEDGDRKIGTTTDVMVTSVLQTSAGRMIFARLKGS
jgi:uncharacterized protein YacL